MFSYLLTQQRTEKRLILWRNFARPAVLAAAGARSILKWIVNFDRVVSDESVCAALSVPAPAKECSYVAFAALPANQGADTSRIKVVRRPLDDVCWWRGQDAGMVKGKSKRVGSLSMTKRIGGIDCWGRLDPELMTQSGAGANDIIAGPRSKRNVMRVVVKRS